MEEELRDVGAVRLTEVFGTTYYPFESLKVSPAELAIALKTSYRNWTFFLGGGPGLNPGYGVPDGRVYAIGGSLAPAAAGQPPPIPDVTALDPGGLEGFPSDYSFDRDLDTLESGAPPPRPFGISSLCTRSRTSGLVTSCSIFCRNHSVRRRISAR